MAKIPIKDRMISGVRDAIISFVGFFIAYVVAAREPKFSLHWWMIVLGVWIAYWIIIWLAQLAWSRYRRPPN
jgi:hypothetical protein